MCCLPYGQQDLDGLSNQGVEIERVLLIACSVIQVGDVAKVDSTYPRCATCTGQGVVSCGGRGFRRINVQPEAERGRRSHSRV